MFYEHSDNYLVHYGVKGQKHGVRRFQNEDGSLTAEGRDHYGVGDGKSRGIGDSKSGKLTKTNYKVLFRKNNASGSIKKQDGSENEEANKKAKRRDALKKAAIGVGAAAAIAALGYGASTKLRNDMREKASKLSDRHSKFLNESIKDLHSAHRDAAASRSKLGKSNDSLTEQANRLRYKMDMAAVRHITREASRHTDLSARYDRMSVSATRRQAVSNFLKNRGRIVI